MDRRLVVFRDESYGKISSWKWDFGDSTSSSEQNPVHLYSKPGAYNVTLSVAGPQGSVKFTRLGDVTVR